MTFRLFPTEDLTQTACSNRPNWDPVTGPASAWAEAAYIFQSPFGIVLLGVFALAILSFKNQWLLGAGLGAAVFGSLIHFASGPSALSQDFMTENCIGPKFTAVAICAAICLICAGIYSIKRRLIGDQNA